LQVLCDPTAASTTLISIARCGKLDFPVIVVSDTVCDGVEINTPPADSGVSGSFGGLGNPCALTIRWFDRCAVMQAELLLALDRTATAAPRWRLKDLRWSVAGATAHRRRFIEEGPSRDRENAGGGRVCEWALVHLVCCPVRRAIRLSCTAIVQRCIRERLGAALIAGR